MKNGERRKRFSCWKKYDKNLIKLYIIIIHLRKLVNKPNHQILIKAYLVWTKLGIKRFGFRLEKIIYVFRRLSLFWANGVSGCEYEGKEWSQRLIAIFRMPSQASAQPLCAYGCFSVLLSPETWRDGCDERGEGTWTTKKLNHWILIPFFILKRYDV